ncbi:hypothetical protein M422DRAFT_123886, partial [Sphaerobolus stellatus SS14]
KPDNDSEKAATELLKYVQYVSKEITGSSAEVNAMREEIRSIIRSRGLPHLYVTINPADFHNPLFQIFAGREIDMNKFFDKAAGNAEAFIRAKTVAENPIAAAKGFEYLINGFTNILLGCKRPDKIGIFGKVDSYYGVVEAQGRGSLHCHFFVWLEDGLSPNEVKEKAMQDPVWKQSLF